LAEGETAIRAPGDGAVITYQTVFDTLGSHQVKDKVDKHTIYVDNANMVC
jgi:hypothetical protein